MRDDWRSRFLEVCVGMGIFVLVISITGVPSSFPIFAIEGISFLVIVPTGLWWLASERVASEN